MYPWVFQFRFPFSGDVAQEIEPHTTWDLPFSGPYRGNRGMERRILAEGAGYGEQLGALMDAVSALIVRAKAENDPACRELVELRAKIAQVKRDHRKEALDQAKKALESLRKTDEAAYLKLLGEVAASR